MGQPISSSEEEAASSSGTVEAAAIPGYDPVKSIEKLLRDNEKITRDNREVTNDNTKIKEEIKKLNYFMVGVLLVLFVTVIAMAVGLGGIIVETFRSKEATYNEIGNEIREQRQKIDGFENKLDRIYDAIEKQAKAGWFLAPLPTSTKATSSNP